VTGPALKVLAWAQSKTYPLGYTNWFRELESLSHDIGYLDRCVAKLTGDVSCPCEHAAQAVDPGFRVGAEHDGHWVLEPSGNVGKAKEVWAAAVAAFGNGWERGGNRVETGGKGVG